MSETASAPVPVESTTGRSVIVVGYSATAEGRAALHWALSEAILRSSELIVVHTVPDTEIADLTSELQASGVPHEIRFARDAHEIEREGDGRGAEKWTGVLLIGKAGLDEKHRSHRQQDAVPENEEPAARSAGLRPGALEVRIGSSRAGGRRSIVLLAQDQQQRTEHHGPHAEREHGMGRAEDFHVQPVGIVPPIVEGC